MFSAKLSAPYSPGIRPATTVAGDLRNQDISSLKSNLSTIRQKLYSRLVIRLTEQFGADAATQEIIKSQLDKEMCGAYCVDKQLFIKISNQISMMLGRTPSSKKRYSNVLGANSTAVS